MTATASASRDVYVNFTRELNGDTVESLLRCLSGLADEGVSRVVLCIASPGGNFGKALAAYNMLRALPLQLVTHGIGDVSSAAVIVFLAGAERYACPQSTFLLHPGSIATNGASDLDVRFMSERIDGLNRNDDRERVIVAERTRLTSAQIRRLVKGSTTLSARQAVEAGIVQRIRPLRIPPGARIVTAGGSA